MEYIWKYKTPEGFDDLVMSGDGEALTGLWLLQLPKFQQLEMPTGS